MIRKDDGGSSRPEADARDAAVPDLATEPQVEATSEDVAREVGPESGPEVGPDAAEVEPEGGPEAAPDVPDDAGSMVRIDVGADLREAGQADRPGTVAETGPEIGGEAGLESGPDLARDLASESVIDGGPAGCPAWTSTTTLAELEWPPTVSAFVVQGDNLFVGISKPGTEVIPPSNAIVAISISTGKVKTFALGAILPGMLAAGRDELFYIQGRAAPAGGGAWSFDYPDLARLDLATGQTSVVDAELFPMGYTFLSVVGNTGGEVFWSMLASPNAPAGVIRRWDQATRSAKTLVEVEQAPPVLADQDRLYWAAQAASGRMTVFSVATTGGPVSVIYEWSASLVELPVLSALDGQSLYYTYPGSRPPGIFSIPKGGGNSRPVVATADPTVFGSRTIDDTHVYWIDWSDLYNIRRAPKTGAGGIETIATGGTGQITDLAVDGCNIYWMANGKNRVLVRAK
jgi:hypothetical protein